MANVNDDDCVRMVYVAVCMYVCVLLFLLFDEF